VKRKSCEQLVDSMTGKSRAFVKVAFPSATWEGVKRKIMRTTC